MINFKYWKAVCHYGHVGKRNEVSVSRFLVTPESFHIIDVLETIKNMPGVKKTTSLACISTIKPITEEEFKIGKLEEEENFYLKKLKSHSPFDTQKYIA